jgi:GTP-binding protein EngB required for normal cell division
LARISEDYLEFGAPSADGGDGISRTVVLLVDGKVGATPLDVLALRFLESVGAGVVVAATKADQVKRGDLARQRRAIRATLDLAESIPLVFVSARTGDGLNELWREIWPETGRGSDASTDISQK